MLHLLFLRNGNSDCNHHYHHLTDIYFVCKQVGFFCNRELFLAHTMMVILYGSQTGNSEDIAERIFRKLKILNQNVPCFSLAEYDISRLVVEERAVFVCSTTGQGEVPDDMKYFWKRLLIKSLPSDALLSLQFCVIGLGDSSYNQYNVVAKKLRKRLLQLGAQEFLPIALFDEQHELGYDAGFDDWFKIFAQKITAVEDCNATDFDVLLPPKYEIRFSLVENEVKRDPVNGISSKSGHQCELKSNVRVTSNEHFQAVHLLKFHIGKDISYKPGDVAMFMPENDPQNIEEFLELLDYPHDKEFVLRAADGSSALPKNLPVPCTVRNCAKYHWDIQSIPRRSFFDIMWHFSKCDLEREKLKEFTTAEGREELYSYCNRPRRSIIEVLQDFPNTTPHIPLEYYFELIPGIRCRSFSIASSVNYYPEELHVLVAVVNYKTRLVKPRMGLCSNWLSKLPLGAKIPFWLKSGGISLPSEELPVIMIGPGTGCAPFRSFIQERAINGISSNYLFFGCRYKDKDFLCEEDWRTFVYAGMLTMFVAFSRDQERKIYVQDRMREQSGLLWHLIHDESAAVYIAGNSKDMPAGVKNALTDIICKEGGMDPVAGEQYLKDLEISKRLQIETWS